MHHKRCCNQQLTFIEGWTVVSLLILTIFIVFRCDIKCDGLSPVIHFVDILFKWGEFSSKFSHKQQLTYMCVLVFLFDPMNLESLFSSNSLFLPQSIVGICQKECEHRKILRKNLGEKNWRKKKNKWHKIHRKEE